RAEGTVGNHLAILFRHALEVGKRARAETAIGRGITSLSQAAVAMAKERLGSLTGRPILVVGAGAMGEGIGENMVADLAGSTGSDVVVANRTWERALALAARIGGRAIQLDALGRALADVDIVFTSTAGPGDVIHRDLLEPIMADRPDRPLLIVDLGMPRNVDPGVRSLPGVTVLDLTDLRAFAQVGLDQRREEVVPVRALVAREVARYIEATTARGMAPTVAALYERGERVRQAETDRFRARLSGLDERQRDAVEALTRGIVAKLLHDPAVNVKDAAGSARGDRLADALRELFGIAPDDPEP
ncbi:MAG: glutamyl-tRNA reductase, partial [Acidimicrobiales bacterium]